MKKSDLVKKISQGLGILALSTFIGSGICYAKETNPEGYEVPDVSNVTSIHTYYVDLTDKISGEETRLDNYYTKYESEFKGFDLDFINVVKASVNDKVFMYGIESSKEPYYAIFDEDGDGIFETKYTEDEVVKKYMEGNVLPEWVLK